MKIGVRAALIACEFFPAHTLSVLGPLGFKSGEGFCTWTEEEKTNLRKQLSAHLVRAQSERESVW